MYALARKQGCLHAISLTLTLARLLACSHSLCLSLFEAYALDPGGDEGVATRVLLDAQSVVQILLLYTHAHTRTNARTHACTHARTRARTHTLKIIFCMP